jgi:hypothetical protein
VAGGVELAARRTRLDGAVRRLLLQCGRATLLQLSEQRVTLLGDGSLLTNDRLDERATPRSRSGLLGGSERCCGWCPRPGRAVPGDQPALSSLIADQVTTGALWLLVVAGVLALWRARQLGRVVEEPLPVVVRAAEAVEGRARLYRAAGARQTAAEALQAATRDRVVRRSACRRALSGRRSWSWSPSAPGATRPWSTAFCTVALPPMTRRWSGSPTTSARWSRH